MANNTLSQNVQQAIIDFDAIKEAINEKGVEVTSEPTLEYADKIREISASIVTGEGTYRRRFFDWDGRLLKTVWANVGEPVTPPVPPVISLGGGVTLDFDGWNYTATEMSDTACHIDIGAYRLPSDGKSRIYLDLTPTAGALPISIGLILVKNDTSEVTIDWGDGTTSIASASGTTTSNHSYTGYGTYCIKIWVSSGTGNYYIRHTNFSTTAAIKNSVTCVINSHETDWSAGLNACYGCQVTSTHAGMTTLSSIQSTGLRYITIPRGVASSSGTGLAELRNLTHISIPITFTACGTNTFYNSHPILCISWVNPVSIDSGFANARTIGRFIGLFGTTTPPTITGSFITSTAVPPILFVPDSAVTAYKTATNWVVLADWIKPLSACTREFMERSGL